MELVVAALGGNALLRRGEPLDADTQRTNAKTAADALVEIASHRRLVVTHGNGPQVGLLALQNDAYHAVRAYPLDVLGAETEGMIGYVLEQELGNRLPLDRFATLLTQVIVDLDDPAFARPTKPIGPMYDEATARRLAAERGWAVARDGDGWRRVVASPEPCSIVEIEAIRILVDHGVVVTCLGGGGIPVVRDASGARRGVEAVIDKDLAAALLAHALGAHALLLLTDVDGVYDAWGTSTARRITRMTPSAARAMDLASGSMRPKVEAACRFVEGGGAFAAIGALEDATELAHGRGGTVVVADD
jgi:carbamate kinase